jgi:ribonuclease BN (tRNA processing enzyme)
MRDAGAVPATVQLTMAQLTFLGSGDAFAGGGRFNACLHLDGAEEPMLLDCGATSLVALKRAAVDPATIGWVAISHLHGDHFGGLLWMILDGQFAKRTKPLVIAGPPETCERLERAFEAFYPGAAGAERAFETRFLEFAERVPCEVGPALITPFEVRHGSGAPAFALRVEYGDRVIAYSGDTEWTDALLEVARAADVFVCECNFFEKEVPGHMNYRTLADRRAELECERVVITHMSEDMLARLGASEFEAATDGAVIQL